MLPTKTFATPNGTGLLGAGPMQFTSLNDVYHLAGTTRTGKMGVPKWKLFATWGWSIGDEEEQEEEEDAG